MPFYEREKELLEVIEKAECISMQALLKNQYTSVSTLRPLRYRILRVMA